MKVVSWNMAAGFGHDAGRHERAWHFLRSVGPDFALLQEVIIPGWAFDVWGPDHIVYLPRRDGSTWGTAVVSGDRPIELYDPDAAATPWLHELRGSATIARTTDEDLWLVSLHSNAYPLTPEKLAAHRHDSMLRCRDDAVWEFEPIASELQSLLEGHRFVVGGDLNSSLLFDEKYGRWNGNWKVFENLAAQGFVDTRTTEHEQRTYFKEGRLGYQLDHVFTDGETAGLVKDWTVLTVAAEELGLSDHAPIAVEIG